MLALGFATAADKVKDDDAVKKEMKLLEGEWSMASGMRDGTAIPEDQVKTITRTFKDNETVVLIDGKAGMKAKITIDPAKKVKTIDYEVTEGGNEGKKILGIYELDGDKLKICIAIAKVWAPDSWKWIEPKR